jgi:hypothetical protein
MARDMSPEIAELFVVEHDVARFQSIVIAIGKELDRVIAIPGFFQFLSQCGHILCALLAMCARERRKASYLLRCVCARACGAGGTCHLE